MNPTNSVPQTQSNLPNINPKVWIIIIFVAILLIISLIMGFLWVRSNFFDGLKKDLPSFSSINSNLPYDIIIKDGPKNRIEVTGDNKYGDKIEFDVINNQLKLSNNPRVSVAKNGPQIIVYKTSISEIINSNKGDISLDKLSGIKLNIEVKNKGNITVDSITGSILTATVRDSGDIVATGKVDSIEANIVNASGKINLVGVEAVTATKKDIGTGTVKFNPNTIVEGEKSKK